MSKEIKDRKVYCIAVGYTDRLHPKVSCTFTEDQFDYVQSISFKHNISFSSAVRMIIDEHSELGK